MKRRTAFLFCALLAVAGCAKSAPPAMLPPPPTPWPAVPASQGDLSPTLAPPESESPPVEPLNEGGGHHRSPLSPRALALSLSAPAGWTEDPQESLPRYMVAAYRNARFEAVVAVETEVSGKTAAADLLEFAKMLKAQEGVILTGIKVSANGQTATASTVGRSPQVFVTVRHFGPVSATFLGAWPQQHAKTCKSVYNRVVKTAKLP